MKRKRGILLSGGGILAAALVLVLAPFGQAEADVIIDSFQTAQLLELDDPLVQPVSTDNQATGAGIIGSYRDFYMTYEEGNQRFKMEAGSGFFQFIQDPSTGAEGVEGRGSIVWGGSAGTGFTAVDLTDGGMLNTLRFTGVTTDLPWDMEVIITGGNPLKSVQRTFTITAASAEDFDVA